MQTREPIKTFPGTLPATPRPASLEETEQQPWRKLLTPWWSATLAVLPTFLVTRFLFLLLTYFAGVLFFVPNYFSGYRGFHDLLYTWYQWDAIRYMTIATQGYPTPEYSAFFPLYPAMTHALHALLHGDMLFSGMLLSNLAFLGTLIIFYRLVESEFDRETASRAALYLSIFPTALFFFAAYNESLFLFFLLFSFYALRRGRWWFGGIFGGLAMLSRSISIFLVLIFVYEFARQKLPQLRESWQERSFPELLRRSSGLLAIIFIPLGLLIYMLGLNVRFNDPLAFTHAQIHWREGLNFPWVAPFSVLKSLFTNHPLTFSSAHILIDLTAFILFLVLLILCIVGPERFARNQWSFVIFGFMALIYAVLFPGLTTAHLDAMASTQRFVLEIFAGFIVLARFGRRPWFHQSYLLIALPMLAFFIIQFMTKHWTV
jgi:Gpi18-like mannosyltransferase